MKSIISLPQLLLVGVALLISASALPVQADTVFVHDSHGYYDSHHHRHPYAYHNHHRGYWDTRSGSRVFINL